MVRCGVNIYLGNGDQINWLNLCVCLYVKGICWKIFEIFKVSLALCLIVYMKMLYTTVRRKCLAFKKIFSEKSEYFINVCEMH